LITVTKPYWTTVPQVRYCDEDHFYVLFLSQVYA
jgi:hypothetical protein